MNYFLTIITIIFLIFSKVNAEIINNIEVEGNKRVSKETIKIYGDIELNKDYSERELDQITKNLFSTNFFEDVSVSIINGTLKIYLKEYPVINQLIVVGEKNKGYRNQIKKIIRLKRWRF